MNPWKQKPKYREVHIHKYGFQKWQILFEKLLQMDIEARFREYFIWFYVNIEMKRIVIHLWNTCTFLCARFPEMCVRYTSNHTMLIYFLMNFYN